MSSTTAKTTAVPTTKATTTDNNAAQTPQKPSAQLEEDDEFEDFPVEGADLLEFPTEYTKTMHHANKNHRLGRRRNGHAQRQQRRGGQSAFVGGELG